MNENNFTVLIIIYNCMAPHVKSSTNELLLWVARVSILRDYLGIYGREFCMENFPLNAFPHQSVNSVYALSTWNIHQQPKHLKITVGHSKMTTIIRRSNGPCFDSPHTHKHARKHTYTEYFTLVNHYSITCKISYTSIINKHTNKYSNRQ